MSDYVPSTAMDSFENIGNALDEIRKIESDLVQDLDGSWSQSTSSAQNSPPRDSPTEMMTSSVAQGVSLVEEAENAKLHSPPNTPPWDNLQHEVNFVPQPPKSQILLPPPPLHQPPIVRQSATIAPLPATKTPETEFREAVKKRSRTQFSSAQLVSLERTFATNIYITRASRGVLARELCLTEKQIKIWFQNRRMKENKIYKGSTAPKTNRLAATAVKNLKRLEEKQKDQSIVSRLMSQRQTVMTQGNGGGGGYPTFISGEDVHQVCAPAQQFHSQYPTAPPPYPAGSQLYQDPRAFYPHQDMYQHQHHAIYRGECEKPQFDIPMPYSYGDHPMDQLHDHLMDYPIMSGMMINEMPSSTIAWGNILDRQLTA